MNEWIREMAKCIKIDSVHLTSNISSAHSLFLMLAIQFTHTHTHTLTQTHTHTHTHTHYTFDIKSQFLDVLFCDFSFSHLFPLHCSWEVNTENEFSHPCPTWALKGLFL